jgi:hypothetical protein
MMQMRQQQGQQPVCNSRGSQNRGQQGEGGSTIDTACAADRQGPWLDGAHVIHYAIMHFAVKVAVRSPRGRVPGQLKTYLHHQVPTAIRVRFKLTCRSPQTVTWRRRLTLTVQLNSKIPEHSGPGIHQDTLQTG